ncbi:MAG: outer membrane lipoprotein carrier protein LolA [Nitrospirae bacterium]|nr:outer membrane lipoprotein carrier protein LolA [Nitrospirota bacterium]
MFEKVEVRSKMLEVRSQKQEARSKKLEVRKTLLIAAIFSLLIVISLISEIAYAEEYQQGNNATSIHSQSTTEIPSPLRGEGQGGGEQRPLSNEVISKLQSTYSSIKDFTISFTQRSSIKGFGEKVFEGKLYIKKPKMIRWDYSRPAKQNIYINGKTAILYIPDQKQAIKQDLSRNPDAEPALGLLSNIEKWQDIFTINVAPSPAVGEGATFIPPPLPGGGKGEGDRIRMVLTPKNMATVEKVLVEIDKESYLINKLTIFEKAGNKVSFNFSNIKTNNNLKDKLFDFTIPKGVEVLEY